VAAAAGGRTWRRVGRPVRSAAAVCVVTEARTAVRIAGKKRDITARWRCRGHCSLCFDGASQGAAFALLLAVLALFSLVFFFAALWMPKFTK
jgi:hypothetical protein